MSKPTADEMAAYADFFTRCAARYTAIADQYAELASDMEANGPPVPSKPAYVDDLWREAILARGAADLNKQSVANAIEAEQAAKGTTNA
jgi:hypothetical protein